MKAARYPHIQSGLRKAGIDAATRAGFLLASCAFVMPAGIGSALAQGACLERGCEPAIRGKVLDDSSSETVASGSNTETEKPGEQGNIPFSISVDGEQVDRSPGQENREAGPRSDKDNRKGPRPKPSGKSVDAQRKADLGLNAVDIQVKYDGLESRPTLNISTTPIRRVYKAGERIDFLATANYPAFIERSEIRIYRTNKREGEPALAVLPVAINGEGNWVMPDERDPDTGKEVGYFYVLRVYDAQGRYDETVPLTIARTDADLKPVAPREATAPGMGEDRTALRNIPIRGGAVTVFGRNVPSGHQVVALGETIPVDPNQAFVVQRILPPGEHDVDVAVRGGAKTGALNFSRQINIPNNDWFYVALADLTVGKRSGDPQIEDVRPGEYDKVYTNGRLAFYLKGKIQGKYLLTAAGDTGNDKFENMFKGLDSKDPRQLLRRLDPDDYYPVYGDDSTAIEDAPTKGKFYVRLQRGDSHVMWGNYKTSITGTEFIRSERGLYGANAVYRSEETTTFGERRTEATVYAAQPDTLPQRDEFLGSGSFYWMKHQDITIGSETITLEIRDAVTGRVVERRNLRYGDDYSFDYMQGTLLLTRPIFSTTGSSDPVRDGTLGGNKVYIISQYEYTPAVGEVDGYVYGGRGQHWINDKVRVGVTGMDENTGEAHQRAYGADIKLRQSDRTFLEAEVAHSRGPGFGTSRSVDGGLSIEDIPTTGSRDHSAMAWRMRGQAAVDELFGGGPKGVVGGYFEKKDDGFSTLSTQVDGNERSWGAFADVAVNKDVGVKVTYDDYRVDDYNRYVAPLSGIDDPALRTRSKRKGEGVLSWQWDEYWKVSFGVTYTELSDPLRARGSGFRSGYNGDRVDGGVRVEYRPDSDQLYYAFGQGTISRSGDIDRNDRFGVGTEYKLTEKIGLNGEISYGTGGVGGLAAITYNPTADDQYYIGYRLDPTRAFDLDRNYDLIGSDSGQIVGGVKRKINDTLSAFSEDSYDMFGSRRSLNQTYGVIYTPDAMWTVNASFEAGRVEDDGIYAVLDQNGKETGQYQRRDSFNRRAVSMSLGYNDEEAGITGRVRGEARFDSSSTGRGDVNTYLFAAGLSWKTDPNWRVLANLEGVWSASGNCDASIIANNCINSFRDGDYVEASLGYAYRPVDNDRLNALFKYTWLYDLPGNDQVSAVTGDRFGPLQRSHIMSADFTYDLVPWLSIGGKYGFRIGDVRYRERVSGNDVAIDQGWQRSSAHLGIVRADLHIVKQWDALVEARALAMPEADTVDYGALVALYRHVGENFKVGVGYNFGRFSDDLRDLTLDDRGVFLNVVGKF